MSREYLIVDGYNVINNWREFARIREADLEHSREQLLHRVSEYAAFLGQHAVIVFDAMEVKGAAETENIFGVDVVFTAENETADTWIERYTYEIGRGADKVYVVTSDYAEQNVTLGFGAVRVSAREFRENYLRVKKLIAEKASKLPRGLGRLEIGGRVDGSVLQNLEDLRRG